MALVRQNHGDSEEAVDSHREPVARVSEAR